MFVIYILIGIAAVFVLLAIFAPRDFRLARDIVIDKPKGEVFEHIKYLRNHDRWNAWTLKDPKLKKSFTGEDGRVGFTSHWESDHKEVGHGEQEIKKIAEGERLDTEIRFTKPFKGSFKAFIITESAGESKTRVEMGMEDRMPIPMNAISFIFNVCMKQQEKIKRETDKSLSNLKALLER
jgi:hypothetical protein